VRGGRNQELALAAALALDGTPSHGVLLAAGTDGLDAGAYTLFDAAGGLLRPGLTHTNVMDERASLTRGDLLSVAFLGRGREAAARSFALFFTTLTKAKD